jgi:hypothetical protein
MTIIKHVASAALALVLLSAASAPSNAAAYAGADAAAILFAPQHGAVIHAPSLAQNPAAQCINGYRITHQVKNQGRLTGGVILKCRS